ncbi:MAG: ABC transporter permease [Patescibacteria group bacterium]
MIKAHIRMATTSIKGARMRSFLTVIGIVIGVASVVTIVSLGEGVKKDVISEIKTLGSNLLTVRSGRTIERDDKGNVIGINIAAALGASTLTEKDLADITVVTNVKTVAPIALLSGTPTTLNNDSYPSGYVVATTFELPEILDKKVRYGSFFEEDEKNRRVAVIGANVAKDLFHEDSPIGQSVKIRGFNFIIRGVMDRFKSSSLELTPSFNDAVFIPIDVAKQISGGILEIRDIQVKIENEELLDETSQSVKAVLLKNHSEQEDFTIFKQEEFLSIASQVFGKLTALIAAIAGISLFVGGIGIMNIMLVSVTERTREIGIRKALGATNRQILGQFLVEAIVLSIMGGSIGVISAVVIGVGIAALTSLTPVFTPGIILVALGVSMVVGVVFGITPAMKAARKDPIDALRHD